VLLVPDLQEVLSVRVGSLVAVRALALLPVAAPPVLACVASSGVSPPSAGSVDTARSDDPEVAGPAAAPPPASGVLLCTGLGSGTVACHYVGVPAADSAAAGDAYVKSLVSFAASDVTPGLAVARVDGEALVFVSCARPCVLLWDDGAVRCAEAIKPLVS
jgi:hypothetical protein